MSIRVLSERLFRAGSEKKVVSMMQQLRSVAIYSPGFISAEVLREVTKPNSYAVLSTWHQLEDWNRWVHEAKRLDVTKEMDGLLEGPVQHRVFKTSLDTETHVI